MDHDRLPNYLRMYRKRACLSQDDVAFLLGEKRGAHVCRHERFKQTPKLETLLAYEILFRTPARTLFGGVHRNVEKTLKKRVRVLVRKFTRAGYSRLVARKLEVLNLLLEQATGAGAQI